MKKKKRSENPHDWKILYLDHISGSNKHENIRGHNDPPGTRYDHVSIYTLLFSVRAELNFFSMSMLAGVPSDVIYYIYSPQNSRPNSEMKMYPMSATMMNSKSTVLWSDNSVDAGHHRGDYNVESVVWCASERGSVNWQHCEWYLNSIRWLRLNDSNENSALCNCN